MIDSCIRNELLDSCPPQLEANAGHFSLRDVVGRGLQPKVNCRLTCISTPLRNSGHCAGSRHRLWHLAFWIPCSFGLFRVRVGRKRGTFHMMGLLVGINQKAVSIAAHLSRCPFTCPQETSLHPANSLALNNTGREPVFVSMDVRVELPSYMGSNPDIHSEAKP